jgi:hypothetical protein
MILECYTFVLPKRDGWDGSGATTGAKTFMTFEKQSGKPLMNFKILYHYHSSYPQAEADRIFEGMHAAVVRWGRQSLAQIKEVLRGSRATRLWPD